MQCSRAPICPSGLPMRGRFSCAFQANQERDVKELFNRWMKSRNLKSAFTFRPRMLGHPSGAPSRDERPAPDSAQQTYRTTVFVHCLVGPQCGRALSQSEVCPIWRRRHPRGLRLEELVHPDVVPVSSSVVSLSLCGVAEDLIGRVFGRNPQASDLRRSFDIFLIGNT
jgi:hypothetical protein